MAVLALSGSSAKKSINHRLLEWTIAQTGLEVEVVRVLDYDWPIFSVDLEAAEGIPASVHELHARLVAADGFILASPEHNGGPPAMLKNTIDWLSRVDRGVFAMPTLLLATSPGPRGGVTNIQHWANLLPHWGATVVGALSLPRFHDNFADGAVTNDDFAASVRAALAALEGEIEKN